MKHAGDLAAAAALADEARCMDLADRYINSECVKRMLQADQVLKLYINPRLKSLVSLLVFRALSCRVVSFCCILHEIFS